MVGLYRRKHTPEEARGQPQVPFPRTGHLLLGDRLALGKGGCVVSPRNLPAPPPTQWVLDTQLLTWRSNSVPLLSASPTESSPQPLIFESTYCVSGATLCAAENNTGRNPVAIIQLTLCRKGNMLITEADRYAGKVMDCRASESTSGLWWPPLSAIWTHQRLVPSLTSSPKQHEG